MANKTIKADVIIELRFATPLAGPIDARAYVTATIDGLPEVEPRGLSVSVPFTANMTRTDLLQAVRDAAISAFQNEGTGGHTVT